MQPDLVERGRGGGHTMAFTAAQRGGKARMAPLPSHSAEEIAVFIRRWIDRRAVISTDELPAYLAIGRAQAGHIRVNHSAEEFARNDERTGLRAHVNTAESLHSGPSWASGTRSAISISAAICPRPSSTGTAAMPLRIAWQRYSGLSTARCH